MSSFHPHSMEHGSCSCVGYYVMLLGDHSEEGEEDIYSRITTMIMILYDFYHYLFVYAGVSFDPRVLMQLCKRHSIWWTKGLWN